jgi:hypothetical protein
VAVVAKGLVLGLLAGLTVGLAAGAAFEVGETFGWWGTVDGGLAGFVVFLVVLGRGHQPALRTVSRWLLVAVLAIVAALVIWWNLAWGVPLFTLEGVWLWGLAIIALTGLGRAVRSALSGTAGAACQ